MLSQRYCNIKQYWAYSQMLRLHFSIFYVKITDIFDVATIVTRMLFGIVFVGKLQNGDSNLGSISEKSGTFAVP